MGSKTSTLYLDRTDVAVIAVAAGGMATYMVHFPKVLDDTVWKLVESLDAVFLAHLDHATTWTPPPDVSPGLATIAVTMVVSLVTLAIYSIFIGRKNRAYRLKLRRRLRTSYAEVKELESRLQELQREDMQELRIRPNTTGKPVRIFMEGAFDMMHFGHANAFRQALALGDELIVGINSSESIETCKGTAPIMNDLERGKSVAGCRFVKEVLRDVPYIMTSDYLDWVMKEYDIDYVIHGDDPCIVNGKDVYATVKKRGCFASIPRTEGVSTTDIVGRMLLVGNREHHMKSKMSSRRSTDNSEAGPEDELQEEEDDPFMSMAKHGGFSSKFMTTSNLITNFARGMRVAEPDAKIIYITGDWDMFNASHVESLRVAKSMGDYVIAGVFSDEHVNSHKGLSFPILNTNERLLSVMGCKYVDDVLIDAPSVITHDMVASLKIANIVEVDGIKPMYTVDKGLEHLIERIQLDEKVISVDDIIGRIEAKRAQFVKKFEKKRKVEDEYYNERYNRKS